jgi:hypothetical protein
MAATHDINIFRRMSQPIRTRHEHPNAYAGIVISCATAVSVKPSSYMTVGSTVPTPHPPMAWHTQMSVNVGKVGSLKSAFTWAAFQAFAPALG